MSIYSTVHVSQMQMFQMVMKSIIIWHKKTKYLHKTFLNMAYKNQFSHALVWERHYSYLPEQTQNEDDLAMAKNQLQVPWEEHWKGQVPAKSSGVHLLASVSSQGERRCLTCS